MDQITFQGVGGFFDFLNEHPIVMYVIVPSLAITVLSTTLAYILSAYLSRKYGSSMSKDMTIMVENIFAIFLSVLVVSFYLFVQDIEFKYVMYDMLFQISLTSFLLRIEVYRTLSSSVKWWIIKKLGLSESDKESIRRGD